MQESIPFTIVIPTKDRCDTLRFSLLTALGQVYPNFRVLVSDNASTDDTRLVVESFNDSRIQYVNPGIRLSISSHWEFALSHVNEGMVTILGDDDGLLPDALSRVNSICHRTGVKAVRSTVSLFYWPGFTDEFAASQLTALVTDGYVVRDSKTYLQRLLDGIVPYGDLPMLYTGGFVDMSIINQLKNYGSPLFRSISPDIYSAIAIPHFIQRYAYTSQPIAMVGFSRRSIGTSFWAKQDTDNSSSLRSQFLHENDRVIHPAFLKDTPSDLPASMHLYVCESYLQAACLHERMRLRFSLRSLAHIIAAKPIANTSLRKSFLSEFSAFHNFNLSSLLVFRLKLRFAGVYMKKLLFNIFLTTRKYFHEGNSKLPASNIYEAVVIAASLRARKPSPLLCLNSSLQKAVKSIRRFKT